MKHSRVFTRMGACALLVALSGCAGTSMTWPTSPPVAPAMTASGKPIPRAQDCLNIKQATPSLFICNGKQYTANELRKMRENAAQTGSPSS